MPSPVEAQLILCDAAIADNEGKVSMLGAGWSMTTTPTPPQAVAVLVKVPWDRSNQKIPLKLEMFGEDGATVEVGSGDEKVPIRAESSVEVGRPAGVAPGSLLNAAFVLNVPQLPLSPGRYEWRLEIAEEILVAAFQVREQPGDDH
jgi:hypothetical protein